MFANIQYKTIVIVSLKHINMTNMYNENGVSSPIQKSPFNYRLTPPLFEMRAIVLLFIISMMVVATVAAPTARRMLCSFQWVIFRRLSLFTCIVRMLSPYFCCVSRLILSFELFYYFLASFACCLPTFVVFPV